MVRAALLHLGMGFTFGALMLFDKAVSFYPEVWRLWSIHVEVTLVGWIVQLAMGVAFWIMPRFARLPNKYGRRTKFAWAKRLHPAERGRDRRQRGDVVAAPRHADPRGPRR